MSAAAAAGGAHGASRGRDARCCQAQDDGQQGGRRMAIIAAPDTASPSRRAGCRATTSSRP